MNRYETLRDDTKECFENVNNEIATRKRKASGKTTSGVKDDASQHGCASSSDGYVGGGSFLIPSMDR